MCLNLIASSLLHLSWSHSKIQLSPAKIIINNYDTLSDISQAPSSPWVPSPKQLTSWLFESGERKLWEWRKRRVWRCCKRNIEPQDTGSLVQEVNSDKCTPSHFKIVLPSLTMLSMRSLHQPVTVNIIQKFCTSNTLNWSLLWNGIKSASDIPVAHCQIHTWHHGNVNVYCSPR